MRTASRWGTPASSWSARSPASPTTWTGGSRRRRRNASARRRLTESTPQDHRMTQEETFADTPSVDPAQRKWVIGIVVATLIVSLAVIVDLASGGRPDPQPLRAAATLLDGPWQFRTGDDPSWATATDNAGW